MKLSRTLYIAFDSNIWIGLPRTIESYAQLELIRRPRILCQQQVFIDGVCSRDQTTIATAFINRALSIPEGWCKRSSDILRAVLSYTEFDWEGAPEIDLDDKGVRQWSEGMRRVQTTIEEDHHVFVHSQDAMRNSRLETIPGNQLVFDKLREKKKLSLSQGNLEDAWRGLLAFDTSHKPLKGLLEVLIGILYCGRYIDRHLITKMLARLDDFVPLKRALFVMAFQWYEQLLHKKCDDSYLTDWRQLIELPDNAVFITQDKSLCRAARNCPFELPIFSLLDFKNAMKLEFDVIL